MSGSGMQVQSGASSATYSMRNCHAWSPRKARSVLNSFNLRKAKDKARRKTKREYKSVICPYNDCMSVLKRIQNHLTDVHKLKVNIKAYKMCLANATPHEVDVVDP